MNRRELLTSGVMVGAGALMATSALAGLPSDETMNIYKVWRDDFHNPPVRKRLIKIKPNALTALRFDLPTFKVEADYTQFSEDRHGKFWADNDGKVFRKDSAEYGQSAYVYDSFWTDGITDWLDEPSGSSKEEYKKWKNQDVHYVGQRLTNGEWFGKLQQWRFDTLGMLGKDTNGLRNKDFFFFHTNVVDNEYVAVPNHAIRMFLVHAPYGYGDLSIQHVVNRYAATGRNIWVDPSKGKDGKAAKYLDESRLLRMYKDHWFSGLKGEWV